MGFVNNKHDVSHHIVEAFKMLMLTLAHFLDVVYFEHCNQKSCPSVSIPSSLYSVKGSSYHCHNEHGLSGVFCLQEKTDSDQEGLRGLCGRNSLTRKVLVVRTVLKYFCMKKVRS